MTTVISIDISVFMSFDHYILYLISEDQKKKERCGWEACGRGESHDRFQTSISMALKTFLRKTGSLTMPLSFLTDLPLVGYVLAPVEVG